MWKEAIKLGYSLHSRGHPNELSMLVNAFTRRFPTDQIKDNDALKVLIRAYGIMGRPKAVSALLENHADNGLDTAGLIAFVNSGAYNRFDELFNNTTVNLTEKDYKKLAWSFAYNGEIDRTKTMLEKVDPSNVDHEFLLLTAHKTNAHKIVHHRISTYGTRGVALSHQGGSTLDVASWEELVNKYDTKTIRDVEKCCAILDYLCTANLIDNTRFPMQRAEDFLRRQVAEKSPKEMSRMYGILLNGYGRTQEYVDDMNSNTRLDKALALFDDMKEIKLEYRRTFHALLHACIPHQGEKYPFDHVELTSTFGYHPRHMRLDPRFFQIERIMLDAQVRYDKISILTALKCLGAAHQYGAMWRRFRSLKLSGVRRSQSAYRVAFAMASMNREQSQYALSTIKEELVREMPDKILNLDLYQAMLDCCVTAKDSRVAKQIVGTMAQHYPKQPGRNTVSYAQSVLRAATLLEGLEDEGRHALELLDNTPHSYYHRAWLWILAFKATHGSQDAATRRQEMQHAFTQYTMQRFESYGRIPIPVRETSPVVPFLSGPYSELDLRMINMFVGSLVDSQDASLLVDVLDTFKSQKNKHQHLNNRTQHAVKQLLEQEQHDNIGAILKDL
ncbi:hypothetical protein K492DRAFT_238928 [Lichtheimia hyalospora FSU 10163]|nr:hypothetical protein K492DRAFT_238928 [Lichtheimia hyalospora FSU 10163]